MGGTDTMGIPIVSVHGARRYSPTKSESPASCQAGVSLFMLVAMAVLLRNSRAPHGGLLP